MLLSGYRKNYRWGVRDAVGTSGALTAPRAVTAMMLAGACVLSSCSNVWSDPPLVVGVTTGSPQGGMTDEHAHELAEYYEYWLSEKKMHERKEARDVEFVDIPASQRLDAVRNGRAELVFGCTGELLEMLDPHKADVLRELYAKEKDPDPTEWRDISNTTLLSALPPEFASSIPGELQGCQDDTLPQNLIAVYRKDLLSREQRVAVNNATAGSPWKATR